MGRPGPVHGPRHPDLRAVGERVPGAPGSTSPIYAPYILGTVGASARTYLGSGTWAFNTATGGAEELVTAPAQEGLHAVVQHQVGFDGDKFYVPFETHVGAASVSPTAVEQSTVVRLRQLRRHLRGDARPAGLTAAGYGLSQPTTSIETAQQDDPNDPSAASVKKTVAISHASRAVFETHLAGNDIDLYVLKDGQVVGSSLTAQRRRARRARPPARRDVRGLGPRVRRTGTPTFQLTMDIVQGTDLTVSGLPAGAAAGGHARHDPVTYAKAMTSGQDYFGEL